MFYFLITSEQKKGALKQGLKYIWTSAEWFWIVYWFLKKYSLSAGFEPAREDPNGFLVHRLNHSATTTIPVIYGICIISKRIILVLVMSNMCFICVNFRLS